MYNWDRLLKCKVSKIFWKLIFFYFCPSVRASSSSMLTRSAWDESPKNWPWTTWGCVPTHPYSTGSNRTSFSLSLIFNHQALFKENLFMYTARIQCTITNLDKLVWYIGTFRYLYTIQLFFILVIFPVNSKYVAIENAPFLVFRSFIQ